MKVNGVPVEVLKPITDAYNKGYKEGYMDACKHYLLWQTNYPNRLESGLEAKNEKNLALR